MLNDPLAVDLANEANHAVHTDVRDRHKDDIEEDKDEVSDSMNDADLAAKLNNLKGKNDCNNLFRAK